MLSIIICSISPDRLSALKQNLEATVGLEYEIIAVDNRVQKWPIAKAYNYAARLAKYPYLFFVHEDVKFHSFGWGEVIINKLMEPDCGVIGFAGSKVKLKTYSGWGQNYDWVCSYLYQRAHGVTFFDVHNAFLNVPFQEVVVLDGLGMFVRKDVWACYPFDEVMLTGFHCYDIDFSLQIAASRKFRNYVCSTNKVLIEHFSLGNINASWFEDTIRLHKSKWNRILPIQVDGYELSKKKIKKEEERFFNIFLREILKMHCSKRKMVLKEFLLYSFSWKHFFHCIDAIYLCFANKRIIN